MENQLRQVIINTHSPAVVMQVPDDSLLIAEPIEMRKDGLSFKALQLRCLRDTWRARQGVLEPVAKGKLLAYLNPVSGADPDEPAETPRRVVDREDLRQYKLEFPGTPA